MVGIKYIISNLHCERGTMILKKNCWKIIIMADILYCRSGSSGTMIYKINIAHDEESDRWIAIGEEIGITLESGSLDALFERVYIAAIDIANQSFTLVFEMSNHKREFV